MTPSMHRNKLLALAVGALAAVAGATMFLGGAQAATWHTYEGDVYAGHAYGLQVPAGASSYEVNYEGAGVAKVAALDPSGAQLGFYTLSADLPSASVVSPAAGRHVLYVYDLTDGALTVRVNAEEAPPLSLQKMPLAREEVVLGSAEAPGAFDKVMTATLAKTPVFVTLLYEGSVQGLDATVSSPKGAVVTIAGESGTAFSPGVWSSLTGTRTSAPENLDGLAYTVEAHAERFEGRMILTAVSVDLSAPPTPTAPAPGTAPVPPVELGAAFALPAEKATAFHAPAGQLHLANAAEPEDAKGHGEEAGEREYYSGRSLVSIYAPDDALVAVVALDYDEPNATIDLPVEGEYVAYVHKAARKAVLASVVGSTAGVAVRELPLAEETLVFDVASTFSSEETGFELARAPVSLKLALGEDAVGTLSWIHVANEEGEVAGAQTLVTTPGVRFTEWSWMEPENFRAGAHTLAADGFFEGEVHLTTVWYLRHADVPEPEAVVEETPEDEAEDEGDEGDEGGDGLPTPFGTLPLPRLPWFP